MTLQFYKAINVHFIFSNLQKLACLFTPICASGTSCYQRTILWSSDHFHLFKQAFLAKVNFQLLFKHWELIYPRTLKTYLQIRTFISFLYLLSVTKSSICYQMTLQWTLNQTLKTIIQYYSEKPVLKYTILPQIGLCMLENKSV